MFTNKHHIVRKTMIVSVSFILGILATVIAAATYDANIQNRAGSMLKSIKSNASTLPSSEKVAYYTLVHNNIQSLIQVLTGVDTNVMVELGTPAGLDDGSIIDQITNTGSNSNTGTTNTGSNSNTGTTGTGVTNTGSISVACTGNGNSFNFSNSSQTNQCVGVMPTGNRGDTKTVNATQGAGTATVTCGATGWSVTAANCTRDKNATGSTTGTNTTNTCGTGKKLIGSVCVTDTAQVNPNGNYKIGQGACVTHTGDDVGYNGSSYTKSINGQTNGIGKTLNQCIEACDIGNINIGGNGGNCFYEGALIKSGINGSIINVTVGKIISSTTSPISSGTTTTPNSNTFNISASRITNNGIASIKVDYNIPASTGYKTCLITVGTSAEMLNISNGSVSTGNGMSSGLGSSEVGFSGSKYYGNENDLYFNLYCGKVINAKYVEMEKVIATAQLGNIVTTPISTMAVSRIPGNTASSSTGVTSGAIPVPSITASKTTATAGETITFNWVANDPAPENCKTITNNVTQEPPYLQGASGTIPVVNVPAGTYAIKIECKYTSGYVRTSPVVNVVVTAPTLAYHNLVNGGGITACDKQIFDKFGTQKYTCSIGGGCNLNGQPKSSTNPSANPSQPGACILQSEWDSAVAPTPLSCAAGGPAPWGNGCSGSWTSASHSGIVSVVNTNPGYTGVYSAMCNNGTWTKVSETCTPVAPTCNDPVKYYQYYNPDVPADQGLVHWNKFGYKEQRKSCWPAPVSCAAGGPAGWMTNCSGSWNTTANGDMATVVNTNPGYAGEYKATCNNGAWTMNSQTCTAMPAIYTVVAVCNGNNEPGKCTDNGGIAETAPTELTLTSCSISEIFKIANTPSVDQKYWSLKSCTKK